MVKNFSLFLSLLLAFAAMAGCGGNPAGTNNIVSSVSLEANGEAGTISAAVGQKVTLLWGSTNAASCQATSSPIQADWDNPTLTTSGQTQITVTQSVTLTIVCFSYPAGNQSASVKINVGPSGVAISGISPSTPSVATGATEQFAATVTVPSGSTLPTTETWAVNGTVGGGASVGTISMTGLYTAPTTIPTPATVTIAAISVADPTVSASTTATIVAPTPQITGVTFNGGGCSPNVVLNGGTANCAASVTGTNGFDPTVDYSVASANGTIDTAGKFTPTSVLDPQTVTITATANGDKTKTATTGVTVKPVITGFASAGCGGITSMPNNSSVECEAVVAGTAPYDKTVAMSVPSNEGTIAVDQSGNWLFAANPNYIGAVTIKVVSNADPTVTTTITFNLLRSISISFAGVPKLLNQQNMANTNDCINQCTLEFVLNIAGGAVGDQIKVFNGGTSATWTRVDTSVSATIDVSIGTTPGIPPGFLDIESIGVDGATSNFLVLTVPPSAPLVAMNGNGTEVYSLVDGAVAAVTVNGNGITPDPTQGFQLTIPNPDGIVVDPTTGNLVISQTGNPGGTVFTPQGKVLGHLALGNGTSVAAAGGNYWETSNSSLLTSLMGNAAENIFLGGVVTSVDASGNNAYAYDAAGGTLWAVQAPSGTNPMTTLGKLDVSKTFAAFGTVADNRYIVRVLNPTTVAVLGQTANGQAVAIVDVTFPDAMSLVATVPITTGDATWIAADPLRNGFVVETTDPINGSFFSGFTTQGTVAWTGNTRFDGLAGPFVISPDGSSVVFWGGQMPWIYQYEIFQTAGGKG